MTVKELREKLEMYKDDVEIFVEHYTPELARSEFCDPCIYQSDVDVNFNKKGNMYYSRFCGGKKSHTILVIS